MPSPPRGSCRAPPVRSRTGWSKPTAAPYRRRRSWHWRRGDAGPLPAPARPTADGWTDRTEYIMAVETGTSPEVWKDASVPDEARVEALMSRMSVAEKVAQLYGVWVGIDNEDGEMAPHQHEFGVLTVSWDELVRDGIGQLTRPFGTRPVSVVKGAASLAAAQRSIVESGRWGIPA